MASKPKDKSVMLGTRISPKAQYGLRLLARVQGQTIGDAVEWAINLALRQTRIGSRAGDRRLASLVDVALAKKTEAERIKVIHDSAPELLDFEERAAWNLVLRCAELAKGLYYKVSYTYGDDPDIPDMELEPVEADDPKREEQYDSIEYNFELIEQHWDAIKKVGNAVMKAGELEMRFSLDEIVSGEALKRAGVA